MFLKDCESGDGERACCGTISMVCRFLGSDLRAVLTVIASVTVGCTGSACIAGLDAWRVGTGRGGLWSLVRGGDITDDK